MGFRPLIILFFMVIRKMKNIIVCTIVFFSTVGFAKAPDESFLSQKTSPVDEDSPESATELFGEATQFGSRPWRAPHFQSQKFPIPSGMERQVNFWKDIYSKYSTHEGVIHDSEDIDLIYEVVSFKDIEAMSFLTRRQKEKAKQKRVDQVKERIISSLKKMDKLKNPSSLDKEERRIWDYFQSHDELDEIREAAAKDRIRFQLGQKDRMQLAIYLSGRYIEDFEEIFAEQGLPKELTRLAFVESSYNIMARSKVGASGIWQIMPYTARPYRVMTSAVDGRNDPIQATKIAAKILSSNYKMLGSWPLALTGYNHGPAGVRKMVEKYETRDLGYLVQNVKTRKSFGFASRNFYACFLAALDVESNAKKYFPGIVWSQKLPSDELKLPRDIKYKDMVKWFDGNEDHVQIFNPHLTYKVRNYGFVIPKGAKIYIPKSKMNVVLAGLARSGRKLASD